MPRATRQRHGRVVALRTIARHPIAGHAIALARHRRVVRIEAHWPRIARRLGDERCREEVAAVRTHAGFSKRRPLIVDSRAVQCEKLRGADPIVGQPNPRADVQRVVAGHEEASEPASIGALRIRDLQHVRTRMRERGVGDHALLARIDAVLPRRERAGLEAFTEDRRRRGRDGVRGGWRRRRGLRRARLATADVDVIPPHRHRGRQHVGADAPRRVPPKLVPGIRFTRSNKADIAVFGDLGAVDPPVQLTVGDAGRIHRDHHLPALPLSARDGCTRNQVRIETSAAVGRLEQLHSRHQRTASAAARAECHALHSAGPYAEYPVQRAVGWSQPVGGELQPHAHVEPPVRRAKILRRNGRRPAADEPRGVEHLRDIRWGLWRRVVADDRQAAGGRLDRIPCLCPDDIGERRRFRVEGALVDEREPGRLVRKVGIGCRDDVARRRARRGLSSGRGYVGASKADDHDATVRNGPATHRTALLSASDGRSASAPPSGFCLEYPLQRYDCCSSSCCNHGPRCGPPRTPPSALLVVNSSPATTSVARDDCPRTRRAASAGTTRCVPRAKLQ